MDFILALFGWYLALSAGVAAVFVMIGIASLVRFERSVRSYMRRTGMPRSIACKNVARFE